MNNNSILSFQSQDFSQNVRAVMIEGEPWFLAADIAVILEYRDSNDFTKYLDTDEQQLIPDITSGTQRKVKIISESGLYAAIIRSDKPQAKPFRKWVTKEVLPSIRKTGSYSLPTTAITTTQATPSIHDLPEKIETMSRDIAYLKDNAINSSSLENTLMEAMIDLSNRVKALEQRSKANTHVLKSASVSDMSSDQTAAYNFVSGVLSRNSEKWFSIEDLTLLIEGKFSLEQLKIAMMALEQESKLRRKGYYRNTCFQYLR